VRQNLRRWGVSCALVLLCGGVADAQQRRARPITDSAERIARETWPVERGTTTDEGVTIFRAETEVDTEAFKLPPPWMNDQRMGPRADGTAAHRERLRVTTPEAYRRSMLYPVGVGVDPAVIVNGVKSAWRSWQEHRVRERIQKEVDALRSRVTDESAQGN
jgi:hypothetical protein